MNQCAPLVRQLHIPVTPMDQECLGRHQLKSFSVVGLGVWNPFADGIQKVADAVCAAGGVYTVMKGKDADVTSAANTNDSQLDDGQFKQ